MPKSDYDYSTEQIWHREFNSLLDHGNLNENILCKFVDRDSQYACPHYI